jgi:hypothetical protein
VKILLIAAALVLVCSAALARDGLPPPGNMPSAAPAPREPRQRLPEGRRPAVPDEVFRNDYDIEDGTVHNRPVDSCGIPLTPRYGEAPTSLDQLHCNHDVPPPTPGTPQQQAIPVPDSFGAPTTTPTMSDAPSWLKRSQVKTRRPSPPLR